MSGTTTRYADVLARMRKEFDEGFESVRSFEVEETESFLVVRLGEERFALRLGELAGIEAAPKFTPVPLDLPALMGVAGIGGVLVPIYRLGLLMDRSIPGESKQWVALCRASSPVGLVVDGLVGQVEAPRSSVHPAGPAARKHVTQLLQTDGGFQPIVDVSSVILELERLTSGHRAASGSNQREDSSG